MTRSVGVEFTPAHVRILCLEHAGKQTKILQFLEQPIPSSPDVSWEKRASGALKEAFAAGKIPRGRVAAAIDSGEAILREVSLPFKGEEQIRKTVRFEMESLVHNYTIEQLIVAHYKTGETDKASLLLAAAVPKAAIQGCSELFHDASIDPVAIDLDVCAVFNAMRHAEAIDPAQTQLLIYGTPKFTKLMLIEQGRPRSIRTIRFSLGATPSEAAPVATENIPIVLVSGEESREFSSLDEERQSALIGILAREISRFLLGNAAGSSPAHLLLAGEFENPEAARRIEAATQIPVRTFDLAAAVDPSFAKGTADPAHLAAPLGLALKAAGVDALGMDFRQEEFKFTRKFEAVKTTALVTLELVIVFLAAIALHFYFKQKDLQRDLGTVLDDQRDLVERATGETLSDRTAAYSRFSGLYRTALEATGSDLPIKASAREAWRELFTAIDRFQKKYAERQIGEGSLYLDMQNVDIQQNTLQGNESLTMTLRGKIRNLEFANLLKQEVRAAEMFANADYVGSLNPDADTLIQFTLQAQRKGK